MRIFNQDRGTGKTTKLIHLMFQPGNEDVVYVAPTFQQADYAWDLARELYPDKVTKESYKRFTRNDRNIGQRFPQNRFVVDEIDGILGFHFGGDVIAIAGTDRA